MMEPQQEMPFLLGSKENLDALGLGGDENGVGDTFNDGTASVELKEKVVGPDGKYYFPLQNESKSLTDAGGDQEENNDVIVKGRCGIGACDPACSQKCANLPVFVISYGIAGIWMVTLSSLLGTQVTSIERHFGLSSSRTGLILSSNDIGYLVAIMVGSHFGKYAHIPRLLSISGILFGITSIAMSFGRLVEPRVWQAEPGTLENHTDFENQSKYTCMSKISNNLSFHANLTSQTDMTNVTQGTPSRDIEVPITSLPWAFWLFVVAAMVGGIVKSYRIPLLTHYVETNIVDKTRSGLLLGTSFTAMLFGPPIAMLLGGYISSIPLDLKETTMSKQDQRWIGAWWVGFMFVGLACIVFSLPIMFFPRKMLVNRTRQARMAALRKDSGKKKALLNVITDMPKSLGRMFRRPVYVLALFATCFSGFAFSGFYAFTQKYIETQFNKTSQEVSFTSGTLLIFSLAVGTFVGGFLVSKLKLRLRGCAFFSFSIAAVTVGMDCFSFYFGCGNSSVVGVTQGSTMSSQVCGCDEDNIFLVCGDDNLNYHSPCVAGCTDAIGMIFSNCTEINNGQAKPGLCPLDCPFYIPYLTLYFLGGLIGTASILPNFLLIVRSVEQKDQALAAATTSFFQTLVGMLPSPIVYGKVIDSTCQLWFPDGSYCMLYDREDFRFYFNGINISLRSIALIFLLVAAYLTHRDRHKADPE